MAGPVVDPMRAVAMEANLLLALVAKMAAAVKINVPQAMSNFDLFIKKFLKIKDDSQY
jgi:hypothetical protein